MSVAMGSIGSPGRYTVAVAPPGPTGHPVASMGYAARGCASPGTMAMLPLQPTAPVPVALHAPMPCTVPMPASVQVAPAAAAVQAPPSMLQLGAQIVQTALVSGASVSAAMPPQVGSFVPPVPSATLPPTSLLAACTAQPVYPTTTGGMLAPSSPMHPAASPRYGAPPPATTAGAATPTPVTVGSVAPLASLGGLSSEEMASGALTRGFPDPLAIEEQKQAYSRSLDMQLENGSKSLAMQNGERKRVLHQAAEQRKQALILQVEQQMRMHEMVLDEQTNQALMGLKKAALDQRAALEQQAAALTLEYQQRKMHEEFAVTQTEMQRQYAENQARLQSEALKFSTEEEGQHPTTGPLQLPVPASPNSAMQASQPAMHAMQPVTTVPIRSIVAPVVGCAQSPRPGKVQASSSHVVPASAGAGFRIVQPPHVIAQSQSARSLGGSHHAPFSLAASPSTPNMIGASRAQAMVQVPSGSSLVLPAYSAMQTMPSPTAMMRFGGAVSRQG